MTDKKPTPITRFGTLKRVQRKTTRGGKAYAIITVDCKKFEQVAYVFGAALVAQVLAAGEGASVYFKGVMESVQRKNAEGRGYEEDQMKVVFFMDKSSASAEAQGEASDPASADMAEDQSAEDQSVAATDVDEEVPF